MTYNYSSLFGDETPAQQRESAPTQATATPKPKVSKTKSPADYLAHAETLHKEMSSYGNLGSHKKALVASALCLYLWGIEQGVIMESAHDSIGQHIYDGVKAMLDHLNVPDSLVILSQISMVKDAAALSDPKYGKDGLSPLQMFLDSFKNNGIYEDIKDSACPDDILGRFYGDFTSGEVGDGKSLGIVLTPTHICDLFCQLVGDNGIHEDDIIIDPCVGTGAFLAAAQYHKNRKTSNIFGVEIQPEMFTVSAVNTILKTGDSTVQHTDFTSIPPAEIRENIKPTVGMINPPYSQGGNDSQHLYEIAFIKHLLESCVEGATVLAVVPLSTMVGKTKREKGTKTQILASHTLVGTITLNPRSFGKVGTNTCVAVFKAHVPHGKKEAKFINFKDDGYDYENKRGLVEQPDARIKRDEMLDVWRGKKDANTSLLVTAVPEDDDEWLHSFYYFNDAIPTPEMFEKVVADYLTFEADMIFHGRGYLFENNSD